MEFKEYKKQCAEYFKYSFSYDLKAGFITAVVAIPLAIGFAIASGVSPIMGLYTAIIAGVLASLFGGSTFSITGPTGAMTVIILGTVSKYGIEGLLLAGFLAGVFQIVLGLLRVGNVIKLMPLPIVTGFTAGIGILIFIGQIPNSLGLSIPAEEHVWDSIIEIIKSLGFVNIIAVSITVATMIILFFFPKILSKVKYLSKVPASVIALVSMTAITFYFALRVPIVGEIPNDLPTINMLNFNLELLKNVMGPALTIALLGAIEALLCAVVCDGMTNTKHNSNKELITQGAVNVILPFCNAIPATAAIARSAVNIREGARTRFAGVYHAIFILFTLLFFSSIAYYIPKAFLAGILMFIAIKMVNFNEMKAITKATRRDSLIMFITMGMTVLTDLVFAVEVGFVFALLLLFVRTLEASNITSMEDYEEDKGLNHVVNSYDRTRGKISIYTIHGPFFFGAMNVFDRRIDDFKAKKPYIVLRMKHVPFVDSTAIARLNQFIKQRNKENSIVMISGLRKEVQDKLFADDEFNEVMNKKHIFSRTTQAIEHIRDSIDSKERKGLEYKEEKA